MTCHGGFGHNLYHRETAMTKMFAQTTDSGTAKAETAICGECVEAAVITPSEFGRLRYLDCTGNDALQCQHCGKVTQEGGIE